MPKSIRELRPREVLRLALAVEKANEERFRTFEELFADAAPDAAGVFRQLAQDELTHRMILTEMHEKRFGPVGELPSEADVHEVIEAVDIPEPEPFVFAGVTKERALQAALEAERQAVALYAKLEAGTDDAELREIYRRLKEMELEHEGNVLRRMK